MNTSVHVCEYSVFKQYEGSYGRKRRLTVILYGICPVAVLFWMLYLMGPAAFIRFVPLCPSVMAFVIRTTYNRYFKIEYEFRVAGGVFAGTVRF